MKAPNPKKVDRLSIMKHIESFNTAIIQYRKENAPNVHYLLSDITTKQMYNNYKYKTGTNLFYDLYRLVLKNMKISLSKLEDEQCEENQILKKTLYSS